MIVVFFFFFFKQKTAYEMRISDWSSDVCSSDLGALHLRAQVTRGGQAEDYLVWRFSAPEQLDLLSEIARHLDGPAGLTLGQAGVMGALVSAEGRLRAANPAFLLRALGEGDRAHYAGRDVSPMLRLGEGGGLFFARSEEHTSELQSLMRISYAVFCL